MRFLYKGQRGFTLLEIVFAVAIVAILASVVLANISEAKKKSRDTQRISDLQQIQVALKMYRQVNSSDFPSHSDDAINGGSGVEDDISSYLTNTIKDPLSGTTGYEYYYDDSYSCNGSNHAILIATTMEGTNSGNYNAQCGTTYTTIDGITPTANSYVIVLK